MFFISRSFSGVCSSFTQELPSPLQELVKAIDPNSFCITAFGSAFWTYLCGRILSRVPTINALFAPNYGPATLGENHRRLYGILPANEADESILHQLLQSKRDLALRCQRQNTVQLPVKFPVTATFGPFHSRFVNVKVVVRVVVKRDRRSCELSSFLRTFAFCFWAQILPDDLGLSPERRTISEQAVSRKSHLHGNIILNAHIYVKLAIEG